MAGGLSVLSPAVIGLRSSCCGEVFDPAVGFSCPAHGPEAGTLDVVYDYGRIVSWPPQSRSGGLRGMWRYLPMLPVRPDLALPTLSVGDTPLVPAPRLADRLGVAALWIKDEGRQPTGSLKDRASALAVVLARAEGVDVVTTASTGNAAAALAGLCAAEEMTAVIFVPASISEVKLAQLLVYGAQVVLVDGSYDDAFALCRQAAETWGWYLRSTGVNPFMTEGKKTVVFEIVEALEGTVPDIIVVGVGDGCILGSLHKGLRDLLALGWITRMPRLIGVQARGSDALYRAWTSGLDVAPIAATTVVDSLCVGLPRDRWKAMAAVRETGGAFVAVSDADILAAIPELAQGSGVFAEPAGAAPLAGLRAAKVQGLVGRGDSVVLIATGSGLKSALATTVGDVRQRVVRCSPGALPPQKHLLPVRVNRADRIDVASAI